MAEYIVRETGYPGTLKQEIVGELVRCRGCKWYDHTNPYGTLAPDVSYCKMNTRFYEASHFCAWGERKDDAEIH